MAKKNPDQNEQANKLIGERIDLEKKKDADPSSFSQDDQKRLDALLNPEMLTDEDPITKDILSQQYELAKVVQEQNDTEVGIKQMGQAPE